MAKGPDETKRDRKPSKMPARLPGFVTNHEIGLGDLIKRGTYAVGVKPCEGCQRRAEFLNRRVVFRRGSQGRS